MENLNAENVFKHYRIISILLKFLNVHHMLGVNLGFHFLQKYSYNDEAGEWNTNVFTTSRKHLRTKVTLKFAPNIIVKHGKPGVGIKLMKLIISP